MKRILLTFLILSLFSCAEDKTTEPITTNISKYITDMPEGNPNTYVRIVAVLPNPSGEDDYNEKFRIRTYDNLITDFDSYYIKDDEGTRWNLATLEKVRPAEAQEDGFLEYIYTSDKIAQLLNSGDVVYLYNPEGVLIQTVSYGQSKDGEWVYVD
ncbi:MAG: hypothetical protein WC121_14200 [Candidatus Kapaibacterium sp.]